MDFLHALNLRVTRKCAQIFPVGAFFSHAFACRSRLCAEQNKFAQFASRDGITRPESIKKERISDK
jgi:hypothetical protein